MKYLRFLSVLAIFSLACTGNADAGGGGDKKEDGAGGKEYVKMQPLMVPVIDNYGVSQVVSLVVSIEVDGVSDADKIKAMKPRLTDAYIQNMYGAMSDTVGMKDGILQVAVIKKRLNEITSDVMGDDMHAEVLLQVVQQRPI